MQPRYIEGTTRLYCFELSTTEGEQDNCTGDLEDTLFLSEQDKARALKLLDVGIKRLEFDRLPECRFWQIQCKLERRAKAREIEAAAAALGPKTGPP